MFRLRLYVLLFWENLVPWHLVPKSLSHHKMIAKYNFKEMQFRAGRVQSRSYRILIRSILSLRSMIEVDLKNRLLFWRFLRLFGDSHKFRIFLSIAIWRFLSLFRRFLSIFRRLTLMAGNCVRVWITMLTNCRTKILFFHFRFLKIPAYAKILNVAILF